MRILLVLPVLVLIGLVLVVTFGTIDLPRRNARRPRFTRMFCQPTWVGRGAPAHRLRDAIRATHLCYSALLSLICLIVLWGAGLTAGFAPHHVGFGTAMQGSEDLAGFGGALCMSGVFLSTPDLGDITHRDQDWRAARVAGRS